MRPLAVHYHSDGTGSDSYIGRTEGGLSQIYSSVDFKTAFKQSLRRSTSSLTTFVKKGGHEAGLSKTKSCFLKKADESDAKKTD